MRTIVGNWTADRLGREGVGKHCRSQVGVVPSHTTTTTVRNRHLIFLDGSRSHQFQEQDGIARMGLRQSRYD